MTRSKKRCVDIVSVGEPPKNIKDYTENIKFIIYNFKERGETRGKSIISPTLKAHGFDWCIEVYPRGDDASSSSTEHISCHLFLSEGNNKSVTANFALGYKAQFKEKSIHTFEGDDGWGWKDFIERDYVIANYLEEDGSLVVEADIQIAEEDRRIWYPKKFQRQELLVELYKNRSFSGTCDVVFLAEGKQYRAHKSVLSLQCKKLYELSEDCDENTPIPIPSVRAEIFERILECVYTINTPEIENKDVATELLVATDQYEYVHLKLYVESIMADKFLNAENAAAMLILADAHSCALLKEAATNLFLIDAEEVKNSEAWSQVEESKRLLNELLGATLIKLQRVIGNKKEKKDKNEIDRMDVSALRRALENRNLELDGSREVLVDRLKTHDEGQGTEN